MKDTLEVFALTEQDRPAWQNYVCQHADASIYHDLAWKTIFESAFGYRSWYLLARATETGDIAGCVPLFLVTSPWSRRLVAVPFRDRGGLLWSSPAAFTALVAAAQRLAQNLRADFLEFKSLTPYPAALVQAAGLCERWYWVDSRVNLAGLDIQQFREKIGYKARNKVAQAEKAQLTFSEITPRADGVALWYALYLRTQKRLGLPPFPEKFFRSMIQQLAPQNALRLFAVMQQDRPVAAAIVLLHRQCGIYAYSASETTLRAVRPNDFMVYQIIQWLLAHQFREFDLGSDAPAQQSLLEFKKKWLAVQVRIPVYSLGKVDSAADDSSDPRYALLRKVFQHLPVSLLRAIGGLTVKFFG